jgi:hypothetical protein
MALARSNIHYGSAGPSRGRGRARADHGHRAHGAHHGAAGGWLTMVASPLGWQCKLEGFWGVHLARWEAAELT